MDSLPIPQLDDFRTLIESALAYGNGTHGFADIRDMVSRGEAHFWPGVNSCIVTEFVSSPGKQFLNFFLAAGHLGELEAMTPLVLKWGKLNGCTHALLTGRPGWQKTFLAKTGWKKESAIIMEKEL